MHLLLEAHESRALRPVGDEGDVDTLRRDEHIGDDRAHELDHLQPVLVLDRTRGVQHKRDVSLASARCKS